MPLLFQGVQGSTLVECPKGKNCEDKCGENILFSLGDQESNKCRYFEPAEIDRMARETYKLDRVDWLCSNSKGGGGSFWGKNLGRFSSNFACKSKKNPSDLLGISHSNSKNRYSASSK